MLVMVLGGNFYKIDERGLLGNINLIKKHKFIQTRNISGR